MQIAPFSSRLGNARGTPCLAIPVATAPVGWQQPSFRQVHASSSGQQDVRRERRVVPLPSLSFGSAAAPVAAGRAAQRGVAAALLERHAHQTKLCRRRDVQCQQRGGRGGGQGPQDRMQNMELLVGDCLCLLCFSLYKQITALIFLPSFPGWLAPLAFNPTRFLEFISFATTLCGTWVASGYLTGGYRFEATADAQTALSRTCLMWLISMPVVAAQLVLLTAAEDVALVGDEGFASVLPLAATGPGEPFVAAAGVLGVTVCWRAFYASYLDMYSLRSAGAARRDRQRDMDAFADSLRGAMLLSLACCAVLQFLGGLVGEEQLELISSSLLAHTSGDAS